MMAADAAALEAPPLERPSPGEATLDDETRALVVPDAADLPASPPSAVEANFARYFIADFMNPGHDQYVYRHPNGLCVVGLAPAHVAFKEEGGITAVDFNVGKSDRSEMKVTGKRKRNAQHLQENSALCKVCVNDKSFVVRCCVKGSLLEINDRLIKQPDLLNTAADREGYIAIFQPKPADWLKIKDKFLNYEDYRNLRGAC
ncbi:FAM206 family protein [Panicum miliaceum]|uniref:FAM206 family protein n=1 Tax=Panicum miliaceum TaxID=4540 RepID=A0A3L6RSJ0_PANMI|nr:FAM206 family protein [Panicum miliaceum]